jgi:hypothetical protein
MRKKITKEEKEKKLLEKIEKKKIQKKFGQFYTTNYNYILDGFTIPNNAQLIEPFVGQGDLLNWIGDKPVEKYDIDPKINCIHQDTLMTPPNYKDKFVITNPPYLAKNKTKDRRVYDLWKVDDLYKAFIKSIVEGDVYGGIIIVPLNFLSGEDRDGGVRRLFFSKYKITKINIFEEKVFKDTGYTVCSFQFERGQSCILPITIFPEKKELEFCVLEKYEYRIGGEIYVPVKSEYKIGRLLAESNIEKNKIPSSNLFLRAMDGGTEDNKIGLEINTNHFYGKNTDRVFCSIITNKPFEDEQYIVDKFNEKIKNYRNKYNSLFLTNYRESSKNYSRKRISFDLAYNIIAQILEEKKNG